MVFLVGAQLNSQLMICCFRIRQTIWWSLFQIRTYLISCAVPGCILLALGLAVVHKVITPVSSQTRFYDWGFWSIPKMKALQQDRTFLLQKLYSYGHLSIITGYKWDYIFYINGVFLVLITGISGHNCMKLHRHVISSQLASGNT